MMGQSSIANRWTVILLLGVIGICAVVVVSEWQHSQLHMRLNRERRQARAAQSAVQSGDRQALFDLVALYENPAAEDFEQNYALGILRESVEFPAEFKIPDDRMVGRGVLRLKWDRAADWLRTNREALIFCPAEKRWHGPETTTTAPVNPPT